MVASVNDILEQIRVENLQQEEHGLTTHVQRSYNDLQYNEESYGHDGGHPFAYDTPRRDPWHRHGCEAVQLDAFAKTPEIYP